MKKKISIFIIIGFWIMLHGLNALTWTAGVRLTWTSGSSTNPAVAVDSGDVIHIVWADNIPGDYELYYKNSPDEGTTWTTIKRLIWKPGDGLFPAVTVDSNDHIYVFWQDDTPGNYQVHFKKSTNGGTTWSQATRLNWTSGNSWSPSPAVDSNDHIYVTYYDDTTGNFEIYYKKSTDNGTSWSLAKRLSWTSHGSTGPCIAIDTSNNIRIAWSEGTNTANAEIYFKKSQDGGITWSAAKRLTWNSGYSTYPVLAINSNKIIFLLWDDDFPGNHEIYFRKSKNGGETWTAPYRVTMNSGYSHTVKASVNSLNNLHVIWSDNSFGNYEICHKKSLNGGITWSSRKRLTWTTGASIDPAMAITSNNTICVFWRNNSSGNWEIYFKKSI